VGLKRDKWLIDDRQGTNGTHRPILTARILVTFQWAAMTVRNNGESVEDVILDAGSNGVGVHGIVTDGGSGWICAYCKCLLGVGS